MDTGIFKKPESIIFRKLKGSEQVKQQNARLESSISSIPLSTSLCSQQTTCTGYDIARSLYKSVLDDSTSSNVTKSLHDASKLHSSIKKFGEHEWHDLLNITKEWQIEAFVEKHKEMRARKAGSNLLQNMTTFQTWWVVLTKENELFIKGFVEDTKEVTTSEAIIKRMDAHTVASRESIYKLKKFRAQHCVPRLPHQMKNRFALGFPEEWKMMKKQLLRLLKEGEPRDFQLEENDNAFSQESSSAVFPNPCVQPSEENHHKEFTNKTEEKSFAFSPLVAKKKRDLQVTVEKLYSENIGNRLRLEEERTNDVAKRNEPQCSKSGTITKGNFLSTKMTYEIVSDNSEDSSNEGARFLRTRTNCQDGKSKNKQHGNTKKESKSKDKQSGTFQWNKNDNVASPESCAVFPNPSGQTSKENNRVEFTNKTEEKSFGFSPLVAKKKRDLPVTVEKLHSENIGNKLNLEEERTNDVAKRNELRCSKSDTITKENFLSTKMTFEIVSDSSEDSSSEGAGFLKMRTNCQDGKSKDEHHGNTKKKSKSKDKQSGTFQWNENDNVASPESCCAVFPNPSGQSSKKNNRVEFTNKTEEKSFGFSPLVAKKKRDLPVTVEKLHSENIGNKLNLEEERTNDVAKRNELQCSKSDTITKENFLSTKMTFDIVSDNSEDSSSEGAGFLRTRTNCQDGKRKDEHHGNSKKKSKSKAKQTRNKEEEYKSKDKQTENKKKQSKSKDKECANENKESGVKRTNTIQQLAGNEILLEKWFPVLNENELCFRGVRSDVCDKKSYTTTSVKSRLTSDIVSLVDGNTCKLIGQLNDEHNCIPKEILPKFKSGVPIYWRAVLARWLAYSKTTEGTVFSCCSKGEPSTRGTSPHQNNQQQGILKRSSRGRVLLQPVKHWLGETPSSVINNMIHHREEKQVEFLNSKRSRPLPAEKTPSSTSDEKECGELNKPDALPQKNLKNPVNVKRKKELVVRNVKKSKEEHQPSNHPPDKVVDREPYCATSCPDTQFENPTYFVDSERRVLRSRSKKNVAQKESSHAILDDDRSDGIGKNAFSRSSHSRNRKNLRKLKESSTVPVLDSDDKDITSAGKRKKTNKEDKVGPEKSKQTVKKINKKDEVGPKKSKQTMKKTNKKDEVCPEKSKQTMKKTTKKDEVCPSKLSDVDIDFTDFLGKPPRTLKQRKKLDQVVKTLSQNNKKNVDIFSDTAEDHDNTRAAWDDFVGVDKVASFNIGEETPRSKALGGSFFKTPDNSPSHSIFQITPCDSYELQKYVHLQKKKEDKAVSKTGTKRTKLPFVHTSSGNHVEEKVFASLLKGEPCLEHISKELRPDSDDRDDSDSFTERSY